MDSSYRIFVTTFSKKIYHKKRYEIPIEVGAEKSRDFLYAVKDNTGDNISSENTYFGELTAMYWIWKNTSSDYVGLGHYNKTLGITPTKAKKILNSGYDVIVAKQGTVLDHARVEQYNIFVQVLKNYNGDFYNIYSHCYNSAGGGMVI